MKIISKFTDYYDTAQMYYSDDVTFVRHNDEITCETAKNYYDLNANSTARMLKNVIRYFIQTYYTYSRSNGEYCTKHGEIIDMPPTVTVCVVGVCGIVYFRTEYEFTIKSQVHTKIEYTAFDDFKSNLNTPNRTFWYSELVNNIQTVEDRLIGYFEEYNTPIFTVRLDTSIQKQYRIHVILDTGPNLKELGFFKIQDTYTIYQNIEMYLTNVLTKQEDPTQITDNVVLRDAKGFDEWSFKKLPTKKRKKK